MQNHASQDTSAPQQPQSGNRFFAWLRSLGITRQPGWLGGVAAGIALRLGIDPIIVRGILVVLGLLGAPVLLLYAAAWALLPDRSNLIHAEELGRGRVNGAMAGIAVMALLVLWPWGNGFAPFSFLLWPFFAFNDWFGFDWNFGGPIGAVFSVLWTLALIGLAIWAVVAIARKSGPSGNGSNGAAAQTPGGGYTGAHGTQHFDATQQSAPATAATPATGAGAAGAWAADTATTAQYAHPSTTAPSDHQPTVPLSAAATPPADPDGLAAWREQQARFKQEKDDYVRNENAAQQAAAAARLEEERRQRQQAAAERRAEYARTRSNPLYSLAAIGVSIIAGAAVLLAVGGDQITQQAVIAGLATTLGVLGLAIVINGIMGKRSGGASGMAWIVAFALVTASVVSVGARVVFAGNVHYEPSYSPTSQTYLVGAGEATLDLSDYWDGVELPADPFARSGDRPWGNVSLITGAGDVTVILPDEAVVELDVRHGVGRATVESEDRDRMSLWTGRHEVLPPGVTREQYNAAIDRGRTWSTGLNLTITLGAGDITIITEGAVQ
ncbi:PspC domain-containing protein [Ruicaihuangia caeni]|uniref:PspC domain-containing protein n=1 Tax=Ruicaihuangia caeni TaxID=3042517 RepID=A0AAW6T4U6_9MICO|nr:PspC domain-containing protein [Klugiella sp. YN-L-19]MDI2098856.1 PspC domain-containing protein [Klugiella sp. YN-L-19]